MKQRNVILQQKWEIPPPDRMRHDFITAYYVTLSCRSIINFSRFNTRFPFIPILLAQASFFSKCPTPIFTSSLCTWPTVFNRSLLPKYGARSYLLAHRSFMVATPLEEMTALLQHIRTCSLWKRHGTSWAIDEDIVHIGHSISQAVPHCYWRNMKR